MNQVMKFLYLFLICSVLIEHGCISTASNDTESPLVTLHYEEFTNGIAKPIIELMTIFGAFYKENSTWPKSLSTLETFADNKKLSFSARSLKDWQVSDLPQETDIIFQVISPASLDVSGKITTTWKIAQDKLAPYKITLTSLSRFCVLHQHQDTIADIFLWLTVSAIAHKPLAEPTNKWCFAPLPDDSKVKEKFRRLKNPCQNHEHHGC